jgi:hypothetical protein
LPVRLPETNFVGRRLFRRFSELVIGNFVAGGNKVAAPTGLEQAQLTGKHGNIVV